MNQAQEAVKAEALSYINQVQADARQSVSNAQTEIEQFQIRAVEHVTELRTRQPLK